MNEPRSVKISVFIATSVDGFIARPDGDVGWLHQSEKLKDEDYGYQEFVDSVDVLVMGRNSFQKVLEFGDWPHEKPCIVLSRSLTELPGSVPDNVALDTSTPLDLVDRLSREGRRHVYLDGGRVIQSFLRTGLIDEIILTRAPILLGQGLPLFAELEGDVHLHHVRTRSWRNGFVQSRYEIVKK